MFLRSVTLIVALTLGAAGAWAEPPTAASSPETELLELTRLRFAANAANDRGFYERLLAANAMVLLPNRPALTRAEYLDLEFSSRPADFRGAAATLVDLRAEMAGESAVVRYRVVEPTPVGELVFESRTLRLDSYVRSGGVWRLLTMAIAEVPSWPEVAAIDRALYAEYAGTYRLAPGLEVVVTHEGGRLMAAMTGQAKTELFPENDTTFFDRDDSPLARTVFERDGAGKVIAQVYRAQGQLLRALKIR